jgi:hypothetical protein
MISSWMALWIRYVEYELSPRFESRATHARIPLVAGLAFVPALTRKKLMWPSSVDYPFCSTSVIFKPISGLCKSRWDLAGEPSRGAPRLHGARYGPARALA